MSDVGDKYEAKSLSFRTFSRFPCRELFDRRGSSDGVLFNKLLYTVLRLLHGTFRVDGRRKLIKSHTRVP